MNPKIIKVLLIDDDEDAFVLVKDFLESAASTSFEVDWVPTVAHALPDLRAHAHDVYLLDNHLGERSGVSLLREEFNYGKRAPVIMLTGRDTRELDVEAMESGAAAYLVKGEFDPEELERTIRYALERHKAFSGNPLHADTRERIISFIGCKGGVGTTTVAMNVAAAMVKQGSAVIAVDLRGDYGLCARALGISPSVDLGKLLKVALEDLDQAMVESCICRHASGLGLLAAPQSVGGFGALSPDRARTLIEHASAGVDRLIIDLPSTPNLTVQAALQGSDCVVLVVERDKSCLHAGQTWLELFNEWKLRARSGLVVVDRVELAEPIPLSQIQSALGRDVFGFVPSAPDLCASPDSCPPVIKADEHPFSEALIKLAERLQAEKIKAMPV